MFFGRPLAIFGAVFSLGISAQQRVEAQTVVYDNTDATARQDRYTSEKREFGDEVELAGTARLLTDISFEYYANFASQGDELARVRIYSNEKQYDQFRKEPTSIIYESGFFNIESGYHSVLLSGLAITVPDVLTFAIEFTGLAAEEKAGLLLNKKPTVGVSYNELWARNEANKWEAVMYPDSAVKANVALKLTATEGEPPPSLESVVITTDRTLQFSVHGLKGSAYTIEKSSDLKTWTPVLTLPIQAATAMVKNPIIANQQSGFFRARTF
jgi:hypothetical protein